MTCSHKLRPPKHEPTQTHTGITFFLNLNSAFGQKENSKKNCPVFPFSPLFILVFFLISRNGYKIDKLIVFSSYSSSSSVLIKTSSSESTSFILVSDFLTLTFLYFVFRSDKNWGKLVNCRRKI